MKENFTGERALGLVVEAQHAIHALLRNAVLLEELSIAEREDNSGHDERVVSFERCAFGGTPTRERAMRQPARGNSGERSSRVQPSPVK
jgi:hypothetical protein